MAPAADEKVSPNFPWTQQNSRRRQNAEILSMWFESCSLWCHEIRELARFARDCEAIPRKTYRIETDWRRGGDSNPRSRKGSRDFESRRLNQTPEPLRRASRIKVCSRLVKRRL